MQFRAGIQNPDETFSAGSLIIDTTNGYVDITVPAATTLNLTDDTTFLPVIFRYDDTSQVQELGYFDVKLKDWGFVWT